MRVADLLLFACLLPAAASAQDAPPADEADAPTVAEALQELAPEADDAAPAGGLKEVRSRGNSRIKTVNLASRRREPAADDDPAAADAGEPTLEATLEEVGRLARADDLAGAEQALERVMADPGFDAMAPAARLYALSSAAWFAGQRDDHAAGLAFYRRATALAEARQIDWETQALYAWLADLPDEAADSIRVVAERWPDTLPDVDAQVLFGIVEDATPGGEERLALLQALADADYAPRHVGGGDFVWRALAEERLARGDTAAARAAIAHVRAPLELAMLRADRRFDAVVDPAAPAFDVERAARRRVDDLRARALLDQDVLEIQVELANAMLVVGEAENVIALADEVEGLYAQSPTPGYVDDEERAWMLNARADALIQLGRNDEAVQVLETAIGLQEEGQKNVSQVLNLGVLHCSLRRPEAALETLALAGEMSDYGRIVAAWIRLCAAVQQDDAEARQAALDWIRAHRDESEVTYTEALILTGDLDGAAATLVQRLRTPALRADVLMELQDFRDLPERPGFAALDAGWKALEARADVQAALAEVGHRHEYAIFHP